MAFWHNWLRKPTPVVKAIGDAPSFAALISTPWERTRGIPVDPQAADYLKAFHDSNPWVFACVDAIASRFASLPISFYQRRPKGEPKPIEAGSLPGLFDSVNPVMTSRELKYMLAVDLLLVGNAYWEKVLTSNAAAPVSALWRFNPAEMRPVPGVNRLVEKYVQHVGGKDIFYPVEQVLHLRLPSTTSYYVGQGRLASAALATEADKQAAEANLDMARKNFKPDVWMKVPGLNPQDQEQAKEIQKQAEARLGKKSGGVHVTFEGTEITPAGFPPKDMDFGTLRKMNREEICAAFRVPPMIVGIEDHSTLANYEQAQQIMWGDTVWDMAAIICGGLSEQLCPLWGPGVYCESDFSEVECLQDNQIDDKAADLAVAVAGGLTWNELRHIYYPDLDDVPWGDVAWMDANRTPVLDGEPPPPPPAPVMQAPPPGTVPDEQEPPPAKAVGGGAGPF